MVVGKYAIGKFDKLIFIDYSMFFMVFDKKSFEEISDSRSTILLSERVRVQLHVCLLAVVRLGAPHRLDGPQRDQRPPRFYRTRRNLEKSLQKGF